MRLILALPLLFAAAACNVSKEGNAVTVQYDQNTAENAVSDVGNFAENVGGAVSNEVSNASDKVKNTDVSVNVNENVQTKNENKSH